MNEIIVTLGEGKRVDASFKGHTIKTDQPTKGGGDDSAPAPFDLFLASIGTCAGIYVKSFCEQRGIPTQGIQIIQSMEYDPAKHLMGKIKLNIKVPNDFPDKYKSAVINAAELCAVKKHLENPPLFETLVTTL
jgi:ribosomal protein S12 methylthiotransferase accessory factor